MCFCKRSVHIKKEANEYTKEEKKQQGINKKVEKSTSRRNWAQKGWAHVSDYRYNYDKPDCEKDFATKFANEREELAYQEGV